MNIHKDSVYNSEKDSDIIIELLEIRNFEKKLLELFDKGKINGTTHTCIGQEEVPVSVMKNIKEGDFIFSNHRGHGHYLAKFHDMEGLFCEIIGNNPLSSPSNKKDALKLFK